MYKCKNCQAESAAVRKVKFLEDKSIYVCFECGESSPVRERLFDKIDNFHTSITNNTIL